VSRLYKWAKDGQLPALQKLMEKGTFARNCLVPFPTITPPNWTTIVTGAWPMTHGITDFDVFLPGDPLDQTHQGFESKDVLAETIWHAAERQGKRCIVVNYPATWPTTLKEGVQIGGCGLGPTEWRVGRKQTSGPLANLSFDEIISTEPFPFGREISFRRASGWSGVEHSANALDGEVTFVPRRSRYHLEPVTWHVLVDRSPGAAGYDSVIVAKAKSKEAVFARLKQGEWTGNIVDTFATEEGPKEAVFRLKLVELSADARRFRLYLPSICGLDGWAYPAGIEKEITSDAGLPIGRAAWEGLVYEWIDRDTLAETIELHHRFLADASVRLLNSKAWDLFVIHIHPVDWIYHTWGSKLDPATTDEPEAIPVWEELERRIYQQSDSTVGAILEAADEDTLVIVVSDHGAKTRGPEVSVNEILHEAGLVEFADAGPQRSGTTGFDYPVREIDWPRTKAFAQRFMHIYLNVKGRDPEGIVEPGEEYERVRDQIMAALHDYTDPKTGRRPITLALRREDAPLLGLGGPRTGDIIYALDPAFGEEHGAILPTGKHGIGDLRGLFIIAGPGVKSGAEIDRLVRLVDVVPTACHLAGWAVPEQCEGAIVYQALESAE
jgi:predicted AlkP superfamily phosphohydrolase/phosphomutase